MSWKGLLEHGVQRARSTIAGVNDQWVRIRTDQLATSEVEEWLSVAEAVQQRLGSKAGEFGRWLDDVFSPISAVEGSLLHKIVALATASRHIVATTNYDGLIEGVSGMDGVTWLDSARLEQAVRGDVPLVLHLHGHFRTPDSIVLGVRSYEKILGDDHTQAVLRGLLLTHTLVLVGIGDGPNDPNFAELLRWMNVTMQKSRYRHFRLARQSEAGNLAEEHKSGPLHVIPYGSSHDDLPTFIDMLINRIGGSTSPSTVRTTGDTALSAADRSCLAALLRIVDSTWMVSWTQSQGSDPQFFRPEALARLERLVTDSRLPERRFRSATLRNSHEKLVDAVACFLTDISPEIGRHPNGWFAISVKLERALRHDDYDREQYRQVGIVRRGVDGVDAAWRAFAADAHELAPEIFDGEHDLIGFGGNDV